MPTTPSYSKTLFVVRYVLPSLLVMAGFVAIVANPSGAALEGGMGLVGAGLAAFLFSQLARVSMAGDAWREEESEARRFFDAHLYWPDEEPAAADRRRARQRPRIEHR
jgi:hypothetical protein